MGTLDCTQIPTRINGWLAHLRAHTYVKMRLVSFILHIYLKS